MLKFIEFESHPKLRHDQHNQLNIEQLFKIDECNLLLYMTDMSNEHDLTEFKHAVKKLPKKMIMAYSDVNKSESNDYKHLFDMAHY